MERLLEDYNRRLKTANKMIDELRFKDDSNSDYIRLTTKASCYRTMITELEREFINLSNITQANELLRNINSIASFDDVKRIWNAAENYTLHELGEICKGDAAYCEDVPDLETYFEQNYK